MAISDWSVSAASPAITSRRPASADFCTLGYQPNPPVEWDRLPTRPAGSLRFAPAARHFAR